MLLNTLKKPNGASVEGIREYVESKYNMEVLKSSVSEALNVFVNIGAFQKINEKYFLEGKNSRKKSLRIWI